MSKGRISIDAQDLSVEEFLNITGKETINNVVEIKPEVKETKLSCPHCGSLNLAQPIKNVYEVISKGITIPAESYNIMCNDCSYVHDRHKSEVE